MHVENSLSQEGSFLHDSVENVVTITTRMDQSEKMKYKQNFVNDQIQFYMIHELEKNKF